MTKPDSIQCRNLGRRLLAGEHVNALLLALVDSAVHVKLALTICCHGELASTRRLACSLGDLATHTVTGHLECVYDVRMEPVHRMCKHTNHRETSKITAASMGSGDETYNYLLQHLHSWQLLCQLIMMQSL